MSETLFDSIGDAVDTADGQYLAGSTGGVVGSSFSTGSTAAQLTTLMTGLFDPAPSDGGDITVTLFSDAGNTPGTALATLGTVADSMLGTTDSNVYTLSPTANYTLAANTRYWIEFTATSGSGAEVAYTDGDGGPGVSTEYSYYQGSSIPNSSLGANILEVQASPACYCLGTLITTERGDVPVETLAIGDFVVTADGERRPVKWVGHRAYTSRFLAGNRQFLPIRFRAGSLGDGLPRRDLLVSPKHAMFLDGILVPAYCLVNGSGIVQEQGLARVEYHHVELDSHDVILAEGAPAESFFDDESRFLFSNAAEYFLLYPGAQLDSARCAPWVESGTALESLRRRLSQLSPELTSAA